MEWLDHVGLFQMLLVVLLYPILHGRMLANCTQHPAQVEEFRTIQVQCCHSCSSYCGAAYDDYEILTPGKVS